MRRHSAGGLCALTRWAGAAFSPEVGPHRHGQRPSHSSRPAGFFIWPGRPASRSTRRRPLQLQTCPAVAC